MAEKLKPEHRKLWRRIYLTEYEQQGQTAEESEQEADKVVAQWEARGAFEDSVEPAAIGATSAMVPPHHHLCIRFPFNEAGIRPCPGDALLCESSPDGGSGVVVSYRIRKNAEVDVHAITQGGNPNIGATWVFKYPRPGIGARGTVIGESSHTHESVDL